jgi:hypothetical protein
MDFVKGEVNGGICEGYGRLVMIFFFFKVRRLWKMKVE